MAPHLWGKQQFDTTWCGSADNADLDGYNKGWCWHCHYATATICPRCHLRLIPIMSGVILRWVFFQSSLFHQFTYIGVHYSVWFLISGCHVAAIFTNGDSTPGACTTTVLWSVPKTGICASCYWSMVRVHQVDAPVILVSSGINSNTTCWI